MLLKKINSNKFGSKEKLVRVKGFVALSHLWWRNFSTSSYSMRTTQLEFQQWWCITSEDRNIFLWGISIFGAQILQFFNHKHLTNISITTPYYYSSEVSGVEKPAKSKRQNANVAQKNVHVFKSNAPTLLKLDVYQGLFFFQLCDVLME